MGNTFKTAFLLTAMTLFVLFVGDMLGGRNGMIYALIFAGGMNFVSYFFSDKIALAMYSATKAFQTIFAEALWYELAPFDVHVLALVIGATDTPAYRRRGRKLPRCMN